MTGHRLSSIRLGVAALTLAVGLAACGGGSSSGSGAVASLSGSGKSAAASGKKATTTSAADFRKQLLAYASCMRDNGVDFPDPQFDTNGRPQFNRGNGQGFDALRNSPAFAKAQTACQSKRPDFGGQFQRTPAEQAAARKNLLKFAKCMRSKGIDFPDPTFDANGRPQFTRDGTAGGAQGQNRDDTQSQAARTACQKEVGGGFGGRGFGGGPGGRRDGGNQTPSGAPQLNGGSQPAASSN